MRRKKMSDNSSPHPSEVYDKNVRETLPFYDLFLNEVINLIKTIKPEPATWLDTGCGTGNLIDLAVLDNLKTRFLLADPSKEMLDIAVSKNTDHSNVDSLGVFATQDLENSEMKNPDIITAIQCHHYLDWETRKKAVQTCYNLLDEGGLFVTSENISPASDDGIFYAKERSVRFQLNNGRTEKAAREHTNRFGVNYFPITIMTYVELLKSCGFRTVEIFWLTNTLGGLYCIK
jgi:tRNA (cmo5U34)-methyltransferase